MIWMVDLDFITVLMWVGRNCVKFKIPMYVWNYGISTVIFLRGAVQQSGWECSSGARPQLWIALWSPRSVLPSWTRDSGLLCWVNKFPCAHKELRKMPGKCLKHVLNPGGVLVAPLSLVCDLEFHGTCHYGVWRLERSNCGGQAGWITEFVSVT